ncbi:MAG: hypothetical protein DYG98_17715 [Haliscomenobacteraceae bacterium CHB4]|nr:hypothetical protein [Saprospiraceae bacterium]MCE7924892.1 hypothetical protein [Haliscomenobacteraceae bacterium CHB4]
MKIPKIETLIILVFFGCVALWAISKCSSERADLVRHGRESGDDDQEDRPVRRDTIVVQQPVPQQPVQSPPVNTKSPAPAPTAGSTPAPSVSTASPGVKSARPALSDQPGAKAASSPPPASNNSTLYVTIDGLKVRKEPGLKGESIAKLKLYEPVIFLNKKTDWTQEISLGYEKVTDHWVKIRTQSGKEGWVFGAGVHYYKMKRQGVME